MNKFEGLTISEADYVISPSRTGRIAVFIYSGPKNPKNILDEAVSIYVGREGYHELIDANLDNPWMRVILSNINDIKQHDFDSEKHRMLSPLSDD